MYAKTIMRDEPEKAVPMFRETLELRTELEGKNSQRTANEIQHLAYALHKMGNNPKAALPYYKKSLKVIEKAVCSSGKGKCGHADVANAYRTSPPAIYRAGKPTPRRRLRQESRCRIRGEGPHQRLTGRRSKSKRI